MFEEIWIAPGEYWREMTLALGLFLLPALLALPGSRKNPLQED